MNARMQLDTLKGKVPDALRPAARMLYHSANKLLARPPRFVIVGTGRCGTGYTSNYLSRIGIPCAHEGYFTPFGPMLRNPDRLFTAKGDASWLAVPFVADADMPVLHQVREPMAVIRSLLQIGFFDPAFRERHGAFITFAERYFQPSADPVESCIRWYIEWNTRCEDVSEFRFQVENFDAVLPQILQRIGHPKLKARAKVSTKSNAKRSEYGADFDDKFDSAIRQHRLFGDLRKLAERYGYSVDAKGPSRRKKK